MNTTPRLVPVDQLTEEQLDQVFDAARRRMPAPPVCAAADSAEGCAGDDQPREVFAAVSMRSFRRHRVDTASLLVAAFFLAVAVVAALVYVFNR